MSEDKTPTPPSKNGGASGAGSPTTSCSDSDSTCKLVSLTVVRNATQTNVTGAKNWATVKSASDDVIVQAETDPNTSACWACISWSGDSGGAVTGHANQRALSRSTSKKLHIGASLGGVSDALDVWVIWADLEITIGTSETIDTGNDAPGLASGHKWPAMLGGGNNLGAMTTEGTGLTYAYTIGKMQAKATLGPPGIEDVVSRTAWLMRRKKTKKAYDNAVPGDAKTDADDTSGSDWVDLDPKSGSSTREIYDLDAPGCSNSLSGSTIHHTAELYQNFKQFAAVILDSEQVCSDEKLWSFHSRVDVDKPSGKVELNELKLSHSPIPAGSSYTTR